MGWWGVGGRFWWYIKSDEGWVFKKAWDESTGLWVVLVHFSVCVLTCSGRCVLIIFVWENGLSEKKAEKKKKRLFLRCVCIGHGFFIFISFFPGLFVVIFLDNRWRGWCLAGDIGGQMLGNWGWLPWVDEKIDLVQGVFAGRAFLLWTVQVVQIVDIVEVWRMVFGGAGGGFW